VEAHPLLGGRRVERLERAQNLQQHLGAGGDLRRPEADLGSAATQVRAQACGDGASGGEGTRGAA
jgi:hypothetical protein